MRAQWLVALVASVLWLSMPTIGKAEAQQSSGHVVVAEFEGQEIDLRDGWGEATACAVWADGDVECFRTETELLKRSAELDLVTQPASLMAATCSSSLRLYDGLSYTGSVLYLYQRTTWINLSSHGFSNRTSSYKVGGCSAYFADYANGGGNWYPTHLTQAWDQASSMISGWNNKVSSIYMN